MPFKDRAARLAYQRRYQIAHRDTILPRRAAYYADNTEKWRAYNIEHRERTRASDRLRNYGIPADVYERVLVTQGGTCMYAGFGTCGGILGVEHDHETGAFRGIACCVHNHALAAFGDNAAGLEAALVAIQCVAWDG